MDINDMRHDRGEAVDAMRALIDTVESQSRDFNASEQREYDALDAKQKSIQSRVDRHEHTQGLSGDLDALQGEPTRIGVGNSKAPTSEWKDTYSGKTIEVYGAGEKLVNTIPADTSAGLGDIVRGMFLGSRGNTDVKNALSVGTDSAGGFHVPEHLVRQVIEKMRSKMRVMEAGAKTVPLPAHTVNMTRVATDPTPSWRAEAGAVAESDPVFEQVQFTAKSLDVLIKTSIEVLEDAIDFEHVVTDLLASCMAQELDRVALFGSGASNQPTGVFSQANVLEVDLGTNGAVLTQPDLRAALKALSDQNAARPSAAIMSPRSYFDIDAWTDTTGQPIQLSKALQKVPFLETTQVPIDQTHGTATDASTIIMGDFTQMMVGIRTELDLQVAQELYRANGQVGFFARMRVDIQLMQPKALCKITGITP